MRRMGLRVAPRGLRADRPGVGRAVAHRCAHRLTVIGVGRRRQGNRGGRDAGNYRFKDHVIHRTRRQELIAEEGESWTERPRFLTQPSRWLGSRTYSDFPSFLARSFSAASCSLGRISGLTFQPLSTHAPTLPRNAASVSGIATAAVNAAINSWPCAAVIGSAGTSTTMRLWIRPSSYCVPMTATVMG
jgi:hypothetical protein